ncbi:AMP-binding protein [Sporosarcina sp. FSL K6-1522]|uniref:AMP-binding protein n=1 Tax=Sporosarcina sp. FSL K6-1522 TaxID=2921554 RepID=UPI00315AF17E
MFLINQLLDQHAKHAPHKAYLFTDNDQLTYRDVHDGVNALAHSFCSLGIQRGDRIALYLRNGPEFIFAWFALNRIGAVMVPINTALVEKEVSYILNDSAVIGVIGEDQDIEPVLQPAIAQCDSIRFCITTGVARDGWISIDKLMEKKGSFYYDVPDADELAAILYTSGTTGNPKGVMCPHRYYIHLAQSAKNALELSEKDRLLTCLPLFHMNAQVLTVTTSLLSESSIVLLDKFQPTIFWQQVANYQATVFYYLGSILPVLSKLSQTEEEKNNTLRLAVGAQADPERIEEYEARWKLEMIELFGMTEGGGTVNRVGNRRVGSSGTAFDNHKIMIVDEKGKPLPPHQAGEIIFTGPSLTLGYWNNIAETQKAYRGGWMYSGDIGYLDEEGFLYFLDRKKDIIRRNGENISSAEIERVLMAHSKIMEAAAISVPDNVRGEEVKVYIVVKKGEHIQPEEIIEWCESRMAKYKIPRFIEFRASLPKTATQKIQKSALKKEISTASSTVWDRRVVIT